MVADQRRLLSKACRSRIKMSAQMGPCEEGRTPWSKGAWDFGTANILVIVDPRHP